MFVRRTETSHPVSRTCLRKQRSYQWWPPLLRTRHISLKVRTQNAETCGTHSRPLFFVRYSLTAAKRLLLSNSFSSSFEILNGDDVPDMDMALAFVSTLCWMFSNPPSISWGNEKGYFFILCRLLVAPRSSLGDQPRRIEQVRIGDCKRRLSEMALPGCWMTAIVKDLSRSQY